MVVPTGAHLDGPCSAVTWTTLQLADFPAMPNRFQVAMVTTTSAQLSWRLPHDGNSPVERYYIAVTATNATSPAQVSCDRK